MSKDTSNSFGGLEVCNSNQININLFCGLCKLLLLNPVQLLCCGTRLCSWCSKKGVPESEPFVCPFCNTRQAKKQARDDRGAVRELYAILIECYLCSWTGSYKDYQDHLQENHANFECGDCHTRFYAVNEYEEHRQERCEYRSIRCGIPGCDELVKWDQMINHFLSIKHQKQIIAFIINLFTKKNLSFYSEHTKNNDHLIQELQTFQQNIATVNPQAETLLNDSARLKVEHNESKAKCEGLFVQMNEVKKGFNDDNEKLMKTIESQTDAEKEIETTKQLYSSTKIPTLDDDSTITFPFQKLRDEMNMVFSIDSPKFKTSPHGYIFSYRVGSTWDSSNPNQGYLSIYLTLLQSDFDPILFYPFPYDISILLLDQSGQKKHITSTIKPTEHPLAFSRPTSERNAEVGIMKFCPLNYLTDPQSVYLKDNVFYIRIFMDFLNTGTIPLG